jgi:hypothetical protein
MNQEKITIYKSNGSLLGYFCQAQISRFGEDEYAIQGIFYAADGSIPDRLDFNPQSLPHWGTVEGVADVGHKQLTNVYVQRGRQPVAITALGIKG